MKLYHTQGGVQLETGGRFVHLRDTWDELINHDNLSVYLREIGNRPTPAPAPARTLAAPAVLASIGTQEVWAAGVTYLRSRTARIEEARDGTFYDHVYSAERPELFFKAAGWRVRGPGAAVRIRRDAGWNVPEPELALCINARAEIVGYTIGNDMSARDIEGQNPLYLPQAKIYDGSCALGPAMLVHEAPLAPETRIAMLITRAGRTAFEGASTLAQLRRTPAELVAFLYRETSFPDGCVLLTGTGVVPPDDFTLQLGDEIRIEITEIGVLVNRVEQA
jgi:2-dehydro-3-deoxy-D-arabinonate dehydratase